MNECNYRLRLLVCGAGGKMGGRIIHAIKNTKGVELAAGVEIAGHVIQEKGLGEYLGISGLDAPVTHDINEVIDLADVIIDFTTPEASLAHLKSAKSRKKGIVTGTTGFTSEQKEEFVEAGKYVPVCLSPNMSVGVNVLFAVVAKVARILSNEYEPEIMEIHHRMKKDAPSGTASQLAHIIAEARGWNLEKTGVYGRKGLVGERKAEEIGIHAVRTGDVVGEHTVIFGGPCERIELVHRAHSRDVFAHGAVKAAQFIANAGPGLYSMQDILGLKM